MGNENCGGAGRQGGNTSVFDICFAPTKETRQGNAHPQLKTTAHPDSMRPQHQLSWTNVKKIDNKKVTEASLRTTSSTSSLSTNTPSATDIEVEDELTDDDSDVERYTRSSSRGPYLAGTLKTNADVNIGKYNKENEQAQYNYLDASILSMQSHGDDDNEEEGYAHPTPPKEPSHLKERSDLRQQLLALNAGPSKRELFMEDANDFEKISQDDLTTQNLRMDVCMAQIRSESAKALGRSALRQSKVLWPSISNLTEDGLPGARRLRTAEEAENRDINKMIHALDVQLEEGLISFDEYAITVANLRPHVAKTTLTPLQSTSIHKEI